MGDPRKLRKKYSKPMHPWQKARIEEEKVLLDEYGLKNKKEIWKMKSLLKGFQHNAKKLIAMHTKQAEIEKNQLLMRLVKKGLLKPDSKVEDILNMTLKDIMERRLETLVFKKGLARSISQSRQFIAHEHIMVGDQKIISPSYLVSVEEEKTINFSQTSALSSIEHAERKPLEPKKPKKRAGARK